MVYILTLRFNPKAGYKDITKRGGMKITNPEGLQQTRPEKVHSKKDSVDSTSFDNELLKALGKPDMNNDIRKTARLSEPRFVQRLGEPGLQAGYVDKTSRVINLMDTYAKSLSDPKKTLKDIEPELMTFIEEAQSLHEEYISTGNTNDDLKNIMEDLLRAARLESVRFHRGDYLDSE